MWRICSMGDSHLRIESGSARPPSIRSEGVSKPPDVPAFPAGGGMWCRVPFLSLIGLLIFGPSRVILETTPCWRLPFPSCVVVEVDGPLCSWLDWCDCLGECLSFSHLHIRTCC